nr:MAG TPA: hypothetical protein [Caudoviricetes sp.]
MSKSIHLLITCAAKSIAFIFFAPFNKKINEIILNF